MGRVDTVQDGYGVITHVTKEAEGKDDASAEQRRESLGDDGTSAASKEVHRAK